MSKTKKHNPPIFRKAADVPKKRLRNSALKSREGSIFERVISIPYPAGRESGGDPATVPSCPMSVESFRGFSSQLSWSHYRALMRIKESDARGFYERETIAVGWDKRTLERQIHSYYYERMLKSRKPEKMLVDGRNLPVPTVSAADELKNPYVLEFLGLPEVAAFHESDLERAIITHLQRFLLELGNGFAFVARQKHVRIEERDRYIDLIFYHCRLKFYLLIDLKVEELTHIEKERHLIKACGEKEPPIVQIGRPMEAGEE